MTDTTPADVITNLRRVLNRHYEREWIEDAICALEQARAASQPLTAQQLDVLIERHCGGTELTDGEYSSMVMFAASVERAHGIGADSAASQPAQEPVQLQRFGVKWKGQTEPFMEQMPDGYWTPWHIADAALRAAPPADSARADRIMELADDYAQMKQVHGIMVSAESRRFMEEARAALEAEVRKG